MIEDELLKWKFKRGSSEALSRIYEKYANSLLSLAMGLLNDPHDAEDVVQDMFVSFAQSAGRFGLKGSLKAYLATSVVNRARDKLRRGRSLNNRIGKYATAAPSASRPEEPLVYNERCERLSSALAELPYEQREAVLLKVKQNMSLKEIAKIQGVSISTVHGRYRYGLDKLRALLDGEI
ncbi:MAG: sigma-70 family RNA polymerase sigma factor [Phycisphaerales bacterium]|nr:MAG: sigma-70 family RNA polymerase sigma factor [Phycisphaerales bacterium]